jgi:hypothetical protein
VRLSIAATALRRNRVASSATAGARARAGEAAMAASLACRVREGERVLWREAAQVEEQPCVSMPAPCRTPAQAATMAPCKVVQASRAAEAHCGREVCSHWKSGAMGLCIGASLLLVAARAEVAVAAATRLSAAHTYQQSHHRVHHISCRHCRPLPRPPPSLPNIEHSFSFSPTVRHTRIGSLSLSVNANSCTPLHSN